MDAKYEKARGMNEQGIEKVGAKKYEESTLLFSFVISNVNTERCQTTRSIYLRNCELVGVALSNRAFSYLKLGKLEKALCDADAALTLPTASLQQRLLRSRIRYEAGHLKPCVEDCNKVLNTLDAGDSNAEDLEKHATKLKRMCEAEILFDETNEVVVDATFQVEEEDVDEVYWKPLPSQAAHVGFVPKERDACASALNQYMESLSEQMQTSQRIHLSGFRMWFQEVLDQYIYLCTYLEEEQHVNEVQMNAQDIAFLARLMIEATHLYLRCITDDDPAFYSTIQMIGVQCIPFQEEEHYVLWKRLAVKQTRSAKKSAVTVDHPHRCFSRSLSVVQQWRLSTTECKESGSLSIPTAFTLNTLAFTLLLPQIDEAVRNGNEMTFSSDHNVCDAFSLARPSVPLQFMSSVLAIVALLEQRSSAREATDFFQQVVESIIPPELREMFSKKANGEVEYLPTFCLE